MTWVGSCRSERYEGKVALGNTWFCRICAIAIMRDTKKIEAPFNIRWSSYYIITITIYSTLGYAMKQNTE